jgi:hypothetical protein
MTTSDCDTIPPCGPDRQSLVMSPAFSMVCTSGSRDSATTSASNPSTTARAWAPEPWYDSSNVTVWPVFFCHSAWKAGRIALP